MPVGECRDRGHVVHVPALVVHVREHRDRHVVAQRGFQLVRRIDQAQLVAIAQQVGQAFGDVEVGREVVGFRDDDLARRRIFALHAQGGGQHLEQVDRRGVGDDHLVRARADQRGELVAQAPRQFEPAGLVPTADQAPAPFVRDDLPGTDERGMGTGAGRVAVQVDHAVGQREGVAQRGNRVGRVAFETGVAGEGHGDCGAVKALRGNQGRRRSTARTGLASSVANLSGRAISS